MDKKQLTEADIRTKFITPALVGSSAAKWNVMTQLREEVFFTKGRVIVRGKSVCRGEAKKPTASCTSSRVYPEGEHEYVEQMLGLLLD